MYRYEGQQKNKLSYSQDHKNRTVEISTNPIKEAFILRTSQKGAHNYEVFNKRTARQIHIITGSISYLNSDLKFVKNFTLPDFWAKDFTQ